MNFRSTAVCAAVAIASLICTTTLEAQSLGGLGGSADAASQSRARAQSQQRIQSQIQQRVQTQVQQQARTQVQAQVQAQAQARLQARIQARVQGRLQADTARAIRVAQRASVAIDRQVDLTRQEARSQAQGAANAQAGLGADVSLRAQALTGPADVGLTANANTRLEADAHPAYILSVEDKAALDEVFGEFNPFVSNGQQASESSEGQSAEEADQPTRRQRGLQTDSQLGLGGRIDVAIRQRGAAISRMRDVALQTFNTQLMARADEMEMKLIAFEEMHRARLQETQGRPRTAARSQTNAQAETRADAGAEAANSDASTKR